MARTEIAQIQQRRDRPRSGFALVTAVVILLLVSSVVVNLIDFSGAERTSSARARASQKNLHAADSGIQLSLQRIQLPRDLTAFSYAMADGTMVQSRARSDGSPQPIASAGIGAPPEGYSLNIGGGYVNEIFRVNVTATAANNGLVELEAKLGSLQPNSGAY